MEMITKAQVGCIKTLVAKLGIVDFDAVLLGFSFGRTGKVGELTVAEGTAVIAHLKGLDPDERICDRMRKKMIALAYEYHCLPKDATKATRMEVVKALEAWVLKYGHGCANGKHKKLNAYTIKELPLLVSQFESGVYKDFLKKV